MAIPNYTPGYPPDGSSLGGTKVVIRDNLDGTFQTLNVDHINNNGDPGSQPPGYHTVIHEVAQTSVNTTSAYSQLFSGRPGTLIVNSDTTPAVPNTQGNQLYHLSSNGALSQITGYRQDVEGYQMLGGILLQWGTFVPNSIQSVTFPIAFNGDPYSIQTTLRTISTSSSFRNAINSPSSTGFLWPGSTSSDIILVYWLAIGLRTS